MSPSVYLARCIHSTQLWAGHRVNCGGYVHCHLSPDIAHRAWCMVGEKAMTRQRNHQHSPIPISPEEGQTGYIHFPARKIEATDVTSQRLSSSLRCRSKSETHRFLQNFLSTPHPNTHTHSTAHILFQRLTGLFIPTHHFSLPTAFGKNTWPPPSCSQAGPSQKQLHLSSQKGTGHPLFNS